MKTLIKILVLLALALGIYLTATGKWGEVANLGKEPADRAIRQMDSLKDAAVEGMEKAKDAIKEKARDLKE